MATTARKPPPEPSQPPSLGGRDEMNLAELPIALVADRVPKGQKTLYFEDKHGRLTITASDAYGLPTATDTDVIVALIYLTKIRNNFRDGKVSFSRYELIKLLGWRDEGDSYKRLDLSFNRWNGVQLVYDKCWWNNRLKCYTSAKMHIIDTVELLDGDSRRKAHQAGQAELPLSYFVWNPKFIESCQADNLRQLDLDTYFSLRSAIAKRLYRFLGKRFYLQGDWVFDLNEIAFERVGLSRNYQNNAGKIKEKLQPAIEELEAIGLLKPLDREKRYHCVSRGRWTVTLTRQPQALPPAPLSETMAAPEPPHIAELIQAGVAANVAKQLANEYDAKHIAMQLDILNWQIGKKPDKILDPAAWLVAAIRSPAGHAPPKGFISREERERRAAAKKSREQQAAEERRLQDAQRRQEQERLNREHEETRVAKEYWESLSKEQQADIDAKSKATANPQDLEYERGQTKSYFEWRRRENYLLPLLKATGKLPADA